MATGKRDLRWFLAQLSEDEEFTVDELRPGDLTRLSMDAMQQSLSPEAAMAPRGDIRMHGDGVTGHSIPLADAGRVATGWQRAVSAVGAAIAGIKSLSGRVPKDIEAKTQMQLTASPLPGSVILRIEPSEHRDWTTLKTEDEGGLADRASRALVEFINRSDHDQAEWLSTRLRELGPRASGAVRDLAKTLSGADVAVDVAWASPGKRPIRASMSSAQARWLHEFVRGESLDAEDEWMAGTLVTVSSGQPWVIEMSDGAHRRFSLGQIPESVIERWHVGQFVRVFARVTAVEHPDGEIKKRYMLLEVTEGD